MKVTALAGGVGGARLSQGLAAILPPENLSIVVNTGDDFDHLGLTICPDIDTVMYTLAGIANPETGWGLAGDTSNFMAGFKALGGPAWFHLGDRDLANHVYRTRLLSNGMRLTEVTRQIAKAYGVQQAILPMCDTPVHTKVITDQGELDFQDYFVRLAWQPRMLGLRWDGLETALPTPEITQALEAADIVIICPSNPFVSIDPILLMPGVRELVRTKTTVAVSPILGGKAVKGPAAKMFRELGFEPSAAAVADYYRGLLTGFVIDTLDEADIPTIAGAGMRCAAMPTLMPGLEQRIQVARGVLEFASSLLAGDTVNKP